MIIDININMYPIPDSSIKVNMTDLSMCTILNEDGNAIAIRTLWEKQPAIFIFLRHFACDACRVHAMDVWEKRFVYQSKGAVIYFIGNGPAHFIRTFKEQYKLDGAIFFTDPSLKSFKAAGFRKGFWIDPGSMHSRAEFLKLAIQHQLKGVNTGNVWQLGGVLAIKPGGIPTYQFTSQTMGDFPPTSDVPRISAHV